MLGGCRKGGCRVDGPVVKKTVFRLFGHVLRRGEDTEVGRVLTMQLAVTQGRGQRARRSKDVLENETRAGRRSRQEINIYAESISPWMVELTLVGKTAGI